MVSFPLSLWAQFRAIVPPTFLSSPASDAKDEQARQYVAKFAAQCAFSLGPQWGAKNAGGGRPLSKDVVACQDGGRLYGFDMFSGLGENVTTVNPNPSAQDITGQVFVAVVPRDTIGEAGGSVVPGPGSNPSGTTSLRCNDGTHYLCAEDGGGPQGHLVAGRAAGLVTATRISAGAWETFTVESVDGGVALKSSGGFYLCAELDGTAVCNRTAVGAWETWTPVTVDGGTAFRAYNGQFLVAEGGGGGVVRVRVPGNGGTPGAWETFVLSGAIGGGAGAGASPSLAGLSVHGRAWSAQIIGASLLYANGNFLPALDEDKALGFNLVRVFLGDLSQVGQTYKDAYAVAARVYQAARDRGMLVYPSYITNAQVGYDLRAHLDEHRAIANDYRDVVIVEEAANEPGNSTQGGRLSASVLRDLRPHLSGHIVNLGAPIDSDTDTSLVADVFGFHFARNRTPDDLSIFSNICAGLNKAGFNQEPIGADETNQPGRRSNDVGFFSRMGALNRQYGFAGIFHSEAGLNARTLGPVQRQCAEAFLRGSLGK